MSIDSAGKLFDWIQGAKLSKALFAIIFVVHCFLLFEQYTDHYRLARLDQTSTVIKSLETGALKDHVQADFDPSLRESRDLFSNSKLANVSFNGTATD